MSDFDLIIIGAGPAGYVAAIRAGQLGMKTAVVEKDKLGGMCLNWGCIPSKTLLESARLFDRMLHAEPFGIEGIDRQALSLNWTKAVARKNRIVARLVKGVEFLMKKNQIEIIAGEARITGVGKITVADEQHGAGAVMIATGSRPGSEGLEAVDASKIMQIGELFDVDEIGDKFVVYGSSPYACETAFMLRLIGKEVTLISPDDRLMRFLDHDLSAFVTDRFIKSGMRLLVGRGITRDAVNGVYSGDDLIECDTVINCSDRIPVLPEMDIDLRLRNGFITVNDQMQTNVDSIYAAGDVTGQITAHIGSAQGIAAVNHMGGVAEKLDYSKLPMNVYLSPEIASVGLSESELEETGQEYRKGIFPLSANGKAIAEGNAEGFVKVLADKKYGEVLGVHIAALHATDMIAEASAIMHLEGTLEDVGRIVHAHPTVSESIIEASLAASGMPRHI